MMRLLRMSLMGFGAMAIGMGFGPGDTRVPSSYITHAPIQVHRNDDGSLARGRNLEIETGNWSGYAVANFETRKTYTAAQATWTVPAVTFDVNAASGSATQYSSTWVGIGGYCENALCTKVDRTLIQLGTEQDVAADGTATYFSWYEMLPQFPAELPPDTYPVVPGDTITASLQCIALCSSKRSQFWTLSMSSSRGWQWSVPALYNSSRLSAVWIEEAPSSAAGILPLADFSTVTISDPDTGGEGTPPLSLATNGIVMADPWGQTADPSDIGLAGAFNVCWSAGPGLAPCSSP